MKINPHKTALRASRIRDFAEKLFFCFVIAWSISGSRCSAQVLPNPSLTPGALNPDVTQETIHRTICVVGWTATVRPSEAYTNKLKKQQMKLYGDTVPQRPKLAKKHPDLSKCVEHSNDPRCYEEDHFIPLEDGGAPLDHKNLWPQPYLEPGARQKDVLETRLSKQVCAGKISLTDAQNDIRSNWYRAYLAAFPPKP